MTWNTRSMQGEEYRFKPDCRLSLIARELRIEVGLGSKSHCPYVALKKGSARKLLKLLVRRLDLSRTQEIEPVSPTPSIPIRSDSNCC